MATLFKFSRSSPGFRYPLHISSLTDNSGAEAGGQQILFDDLSNEHVFGEVNAAMHFFGHGIRSFAHFW